MKRFISVLLSIMMLISFASFAAAEEKEMIDVTVVVYQRSSQGNAEDIWFWDYAKEAFGINFIVTQVTSASDYKALTFVGGTMVDLYYQMFVSSGEQIEYGSQGLIYDLAPYTTPEIMPNLNRIWDAHPEYKALWTTGNGEIWSLGAFNNANSSAMSFFINEAWLKDAGLELPETLDDLDVVLAAFKERGEDVVPMTGDLGNIPRMIANAFGWTTYGASYLTTIAMLDDQPIFIYGDRERFVPFMQKMNEYWNAGYFSVNLFDDQYAGTETSAQMASNLTGINQNTSGAANIQDWVSMKPLTSEWNDTPKMPRTFGVVNNQSFVISKNCDESKIERLMQFADWHYNYDNYLLQHWGPSAEETDILYGLKSGYTTSVNPDTGLLVYTAQEVIDGDYTSWGDYNNRRIQPIIGGYVGLTYDMFGDATRQYNPPTYAKGVEENMLPYLVDTRYPEIRFFTADVNARVGELATQINSYVTGEYAKFVHGDIEFTEENIDNFYATLESLGYEEYLGIYTDYYFNEYLG